MKHASATDLEAGLDHIRSSPSDGGNVELIVRRTGLGEREVLDEGSIDAELGLVGDNWGTRGSSSTPDGRANPLKQVNLMNARVIALIAGTPDRWPLAGDQFYVDLDLSFANIPPGTCLRMGSAVLEITDPWHRGCQKFINRFGADAFRFVRSEVGRELNLRGVHAKVVAPGTVRRGDRVCKVANERRTS